MPRHTTEAGTPSTPQLSALESTLSAEHEPAQSKAPTPPQALTTATEISESTPSYIGILSPELLTRIFGQTLIRDDEPIPIRHGKRRRCRRTVYENRRAAARNEPPPLDLLLVCKSFYFAAIPAFYGSNTLSFPSVGPLDLFVKEVGVDRKRAIRTVASRSTWFLRPASKADDIGTSEIGSWRAKPYPHDWYDRLRDCIDQLLRLNRLVLAIEHSAH